MSTKYFDPKSRVWDSITGAVAMVLFVLPGSIRPYKLELETGDVVWREAEQVWDIDENDEPIGVGAEVDETLSVDPESVRASENEEEAEETPEDDITDALDDGDTAEQARAEATQDTDGPKKGKR